MFAKDEWLAEYTTRPAETASYGQLPGSRGSTDADIHHDVRSRPCRLAVVTVAFNCISTSQRKDTTYLLNRQIKR